jgi:hypothetical protein
LIRGRISGPPWPGMYMAAERPVEWLARLGSVSSKVTRQCAASS